MSDHAQDWDRQLDLKGEVCPYTFVKTKLALEEMDTGQVLCVILDYPNSVSSVPRTARLEGHLVLRVVQVNDTDWQVLIRKA